MSKPVTPLFSCRRPRQALPPSHNHTSLNTATPTGIPGRPWLSGRDPLGGTRGCGAPAAVGCGPEMRWPLRALAVAETRPQGPAGRVGAGHEVRASPEMRPGSHDDWAATPQASLSHHLRRQRVPRWLLYVIRIFEDFCPAARPAGRNPDLDGVFTWSDPHQHALNTCRVAPNGSRPLTTTVT